MAKIPKRFKKFTEDYPKVAKSYEALGDEVHAAEISAATACVRAAAEARHAGEKAARQHRPALRPWGA